MTDLDTLRAAIEARLALARAATPGPWTWEEADRFDEHMVEALVAGPPPLTPSVLDGMGSVANFAHIAANDPSTVERHCLADLRLLERHAPFTATEWIGPGRLIAHGPDGEEIRTGDDGMWVEIRCEGCELWDTAGGTNREWPCEDARDLAEAYGVSNERREPTQ